MSAVPVNAVTPDQGELASPIIFFDGVCVLCNGFVDWVIQRDQGRFKFASLQGSTAAALREQRPEMPTRLATLVLWDQGQLSFRSTAVLTVLTRLPQPWPTVALLRFVPRCLRDGVYNLVARLRYSVFGKSEVCRVPTPEDRARILP